jgi:2-oxoglutarate dehydrogenase E1 component
MDTEKLFPNISNLPFVERLYADYARDPSSVPADWRRYFRALARQDGENGAVRLGPSFRPGSIFNPPAAGRDAAETDGGTRATALQDRVDQLVRAYRTRGHLVARIDPLGLIRREAPELDPAFYGLSGADMERRFSCETMRSAGPLPLREIIERLRNTYCRSIGVQFMHIYDLTVRDWLQERMERAENRTTLGRDEQLRILTRLTDAVTFEQFIRRKFIGAKSFSLEGCESLIPLLDLAIETAGQQDIREIVIAMAHRGRLNVLANIIGKSPREIFREFEDADEDLHTGRGDVKYHLGYSNDWVTAGGRTVHLSLCFNPSHLEFVNPVALGRMRAKQDRSGDTGRVRGMALLIHGDASFVGEGVVQETLNFSQLSAYSVGGALHVLVNNQIGFTTSPSEARSTTYATSIAKMLQIPIFHVNGEDPEAVAQVVRLGMEFRLRFKRDVVIDMYGYRRLGHSEGDEPSFTHPILYRAIEKRPSVREGYLRRLLQLGGITREEADAIAERRRELLENNLAEARRAYCALPETLRGVWAGYRGGADSEVAEPDTRVAKRRLAGLLEAQTRLPQDFQPHPKIRKGIAARLEMARGKRPLDWSAAESLAFATLATSGCRVRLSGQDSARGTFSHRHAVLHDYQDGHTHVPLQHLASDQAPVEIYNSPLSETGVLGFEYGYSLDYPDALVLWEAQFGDFVNVAQPIIDQFIVSAEEKWRRLSGLVLLLPHGFEGMGPEHSSARLERFLELAAQDNIQVACPTLPGQYFHLLRRQALRPWRKPLIVMTPKSLLRHPRSVSSLEDLARGRFRRVIADNRPARRINRVLLCSGKIFFELDEQRDRLKRDDVAIVRLEQFYPLPDAVLRAALRKYRDGTRAYWVQEEPENMGAWRYLRMRFGERLPGGLPFAGLWRPASASPATGSATVHRKEQAALLAEAFGETA